MIHDDGLVSALVILDLLQLANGTVLYFNYELILLSLGTLVPNSKD